MFDKPTAGDTPTVRNRSYLLHNRNGPKPGILACGSKSTGARRQNGKCGLYMETSFFLFYYPLPFSLEMMPGTHESKPFSPKKNKNP